MTESSWGIELKKREDISSNLEFKGFTVMKFPKLRISGKTLSSRILAQKLLYKFVDIIGQRSERKRQKENCTEEHYSEFPM